MNNYTRKIYFKQVEVEQSGPSVNSNDIEQRIAARRIRIQNRLEMQKPEESSKHTEEQKEISLSKKQIDLSSKHISKLVRDGDSFISNIRVACDARENLRRIEEDELNEHRIRRLELDAKVGMETFDKITSEWENLRASEIPQDTRDMLTDQKTACADLVAEKNKLINELNMEIKAKDDHFVRELKKRTEDIELLSERMESQIRAMQKTYREELAAIEAALIAQKDQLVTEQNAEWEMLMHEIKQKQINYLEEHRLRVEQCDRELDELRTKNSEEYNALKNSLETEVETLELQLLKLKATYQLNLEKLEYNFQVLKRRDEENTITKSNQKRKITRMQDTLNNLHNKAIKQEKQYTFENEQLSEDYKKRMENFKDLQKKSKLLIEAEHKSFREIWIMNEEELKELTNKLLDASRVISEQQLGIPWRKPDVTFMCNVGPISGPVDQITCKPPAVIAMKQAFQPDAERTSRIRMRNEKNTVPKSLHDVPPEVVRDFLQLLCYEPEFLIDEKLKRLLKPLAHEEETLMRLDTILTSLGVTNEEELDLLFTFFITGVEVFPTRERPQRAGRPLRLVEPHESSIPEVEESVNTETQQVITPSQPADTEIELKSEKEDDSRMTSTDEAMTVDVHPNEPNEVPELRSEPMGLVKRSSMGTPRATEYTTDALDSTKQPLWGVDSSHKDPDPKHTSVSEVTEITIPPMDDDQTQQKCWSLIAPVNVVSALHQFTVEMQRLRSRCPGRTRSRPDGTSEMDQSRRLRSDSKYSANDSKSMISSTNAGPPAVEPDKRDDTHDESYWDKYAYQIVSEETEKVWDHLYCALERYLAILKNRSQVIRETDALRRQNEELRHLLQQYLSAKVNYELQIPPVKTLQLE